MNLSWKAAIAAFILGVASLSAANNSAPGITLVGKGSTPGNASDLSGLTGNICDVSNATSCVPKNILGGWGSDISYTGFDDVYIAAPDRGPFNGLTDVPYQNRFNFFHIKTDVGAAFPNINITLLDTRFLKNEAGMNFVGAAGAFDTTSDLNTLRLDPEGIRPSYQGTFFISDEYGPYIFEFDRQGHLLRRIAVPGRYLIANPSGGLDAALNSLELGLNTSGRQANRGMEGLAISPDGKTLFGLMQNALIQDHGLKVGDPDTRVGLNNRILKVDLATGATQEFVYVIDKIGSGRGTNELLAINDHEFLTIERDNKTGSGTSIDKKIYRFDITGATDVSDQDALPAAAVSGAITAVTKKLFIDFSDDQFGPLVMPEKIEGLAWGPDLPDGRHLLYVTQDNDLISTQSSQIWAFAIDGAADKANINLVQQVLPGPLFPPGQVKKLTGEGKK